MPFIALGEIPNGCLTMDKRDKIDTDGKLRTRLEQENHNELSG